MGNNSSRRTGIFTVVLLGTAFSVFAQVYTGSITGTVKDPSGAVVPNAAVTVTDVAKGFAYQAKSDANGIYSVRNLPPSTYDVKVSVAGFAPYERANVVLEVNGNAAVDAPL